MIDLRGIAHIYLYPSLTDMRLGMLGLRKKVLELEGRIEAGSLYMFCSKSRNQIKILEAGEASCWLYQNKLLSGKFMWPGEGNRAELTKEELGLIIQGSSLIKRIELSGRRLALF